MSPICLDMSVIFPGLGTNQAKDPSLALMTRRLTIESLSYFKKGRYAEFDASIGNFGCQNLALYLLGLARSSTFRKEADTLYGQFYLSASDEGRLAPSSQGLIIISEQMANLIRCRLLSLASESATNENIQSELRCDDRKLRNQFGISGELARKVIAISKERLAADTIAYTQAEADKIYSLPDKERSLLQEMMRKVILLPAQGGSYLTFASTFSTLKTAFYRIMETGTVLALKKLSASENSSLPLYYKFSPETRQFCEINPANLDPKEPVALIEATFKEDALDTPEGREDIRKRINRYGLEKLILSCGAQSPQFVPNRSDILPRLKDPFEEAAFQLNERERNQYTTEADTMECNLSRSPFFDPNHFSLSSIGEQQRIKL